MKNKILSLLALLLFSGAAANAHCGSCAGEAHAETHGSCADGLLGHYFEAQEALAGDNLKAAQKAAKGLLADYQESTCSVEDKSCCVAINDATRQLITASSIKEARGAFKTISDTIIPLVKENGIAEGEANLAYCPMAFGNTGASWLQKSKAIANPYFGSAMYSCGVLKQSFGQNQEDDHSAHQH